MQPGTQLAHYEILEAIGKGGMGEVWRARDTNLGRDVAIKTLPPEFAQDEERLARFEREAKLLASLNHPNIAAIYGLEEHEDSRFLVLELVEGDTLADRLKQGAIPIEESLKLALQIAQALEAAHENGVIHRDLKPANIKITPDGRVKVLDFGLAKAFIGEQANVNLSNSPTLSMQATQQGVILGTAAYMSPEQARGETADQRTDVWAFGIVLFEMLTGRGTFDGRTVSDVLAGVLAKNPPWDSLPRNIHPRLRLLLERCVAKELKDRYAGVGDARVDIESVLADPAGVVVPPVSETAQAAWQSRLPWVAAIVLVATITGMAVWNLKPSDPRPVRRFDYDLPEEIGFRNTGRNVVAVAPDGQSYVYNGTGGLYLRSLDALDARLIPGTEADVTNPFFDPDSQWVGFWNREGRIEKIAVAGGTPVLIGPAPDNPLGISWGTDDMVLFEQPDGIYRVPANGGTPLLIIQTEGGERFSSPSLLPDGRNILFAVGPEDNFDNGQIVVQSVDPPGDRKVVWNGTAARYVPTGHLIYLLGNDLFAIAFDLDTLETSGTAVSLEQGLMRNRAADSANYGIARDGTLIFVSYEDSVSGDSLLRMAHRDGSFEELPFEPAQFQSLRVSPDGERAVVEIAENEGWNIYVYDLSGRTGRQRLTFEGRDRFPIWSGDGEWVVFQSERDGGAGIYRKRADGTGPEELLTDPVEGTVQIPESWSPVEERFSFSQVEGGVATLWTFSMAEGEMARFGDVESGFPFNSEFSPDGEWLAYTLRPGGGATVWVEPFPATGSKYQITQENGHHPVWLPDGTLSYRTGSTQQLVATVNTDPGFSYLEPVQDATLPTISTFDARPYDVTADGRSFLVVSSDISEAEGAGIEPPSFQIVLNWTEELLRRVPVP